MAPERITDGTAGYTVKADVWSLGISVVQMAEGKHPYPPAKVEFEVLANIVSSPPPLPLQGKFSEEFYSFMEACLTKDHRLRPEYHQLLVSLTYHTCMP
jgi:serine/threonine protein kinase